MSDTQLVPLHTIDLPNEAWPRHGLNEDRVQEFARAYLDDGPFALDPIQLVPLGPNRWLLVNGRHRFAARQLIDATDVAAVVIGTGGQDPVAFAYEFALADAARSALPLTRAEKHQAVLRLAREHPERTDVAIAALVGVSTKTVQRARRWLAEHPDGIPAEETRPERGYQPPTVHDVANTLARQLDRLWFHRPFSMAIGLRDSAQLGDVLAEAFIERCGLDEAVEWTERLRTWATRAHAVAVAAAEQESA